MSDIKKKGMKIKFLWLIFLFPGIANCQKLLNEIDVQSLRDFTLRKIENYNKFNDIKAVFFLEATQFSRIIELTPFIGYQYHEMEISHNDSSQNEKSSEEIEIIKSVSRLDSIFSASISDERNYSFIIAEIGRYTLLMGDLYKRLGFANSNYKIPLMKLEVKNQRIVKIIQYELQTELDERGVLSSRTHIKKMYKSKSK